MSEKMNRMLSSIWGKIEEKNQKKLMKYKNWSNLLDKKCSSTISSLKALESADVEKKEKLAVITNKVIVAVNDLVTVLSVAVYKHNIGFRESAPNVQDLVRSSLIEVWSPLLLSLPRLESIDASAVTGVHRAVLMVMGRDEFSAESFQSVLSQYKDSKDFLSKYRKMLQNTLNLTTHKLGERPANSSSLSVAYNAAINGMTNTQFACKVLAIVYWRLPNVGSAISQILEIPNMELLAPVLSFPAFSTDTPTIEGNTLPNNNNNNNNNENGTLSSTIDNSMTPRTRKGASLYGWSHLYKDLPPISDPIIPPSLSLSSSSSSQSLSNSTPILPSLSTTPPSAHPLSSSAAQVTAPVTPPWLTAMAKFDVVYITFFKEWILHVKSILGNVEWNTIPGFPRLLQSLLYQMRTKDQPPPPLSKPYPMLELQYILLDQTNAELIDAFVKAAFLRTNVFDLLSVLNTIHLLEGWFSELNKNDRVMPPTFDMTFFCSGLNILLHSDHHQTVLRVVNLMYAYSDLFENEHRAILFDLFLSKFFYILFMHWDPGVRNAYQQLLIFKMVRIKRSTLYNDGYVVKELSQVGTTTYHSKESSPETSSHHLHSLSPSRSASGFFSSFSILPSFFNLSNSPDKDSSQDKDATVFTESTDPQPPTSTASVNGETEKTITQPSADTTHTTGKTPQSAPAKNIKMGNERAAYTHGNGSPTLASGGVAPGNTTPPPNGRDRSESLDENSFVKLECDNDPTKPRSLTPISTPIPILTHSSPSIPDPSSSPSPSPSPSPSSTPPSSTTPPISTTPPNSSNTSTSTTPTGSTPPTPTGSTPPTQLNGKSNAHSTNQPPLESASLDVQLFLKLNAFLKTVEDQLRKPTAKKAFEARLEAYGPSALAEFNQHLARYHQWELRNEDPPRMVSLPFARMGEG